MILVRSGMKKRGLSAPPLSTYTANLVIISVCCKCLHLFYYINCVYFSFVPFFVQNMLEELFVYLLNVIFAAKINIQICVPKEAVLQICISSKGMSFSSPCCCW